VRGECDEKSDESPSVVVVLLLSACARPASVCSMV